MLFGKSKPRVDRGEQLAAKPVRVPGATLRRREDGGADLIVPLAGTSFAGKLFRMPAEARKTFELDAMGLLVWESIDGKTSVQQIIRLIARQYRVSVREAEVATLTFLNTLTRKSLIAMKVRSRNAV